MANNLQRFNPFAGGVWTCSNPIAIPRLPWYVECGQANLTIAASQQQQQQPTPLIPSFTEENITAARDAARADMTTALEAVGIPRNLSLSVPPCRRPDTWSEHAWHPEVDRRIPAILDSTLIANAFAAPIRAILDEIGRGTPSHHIITASAGTSDKGGTSVVAVKPCVGGPRRHYGGSQGAQPRVGSHQAAHDLSPPSQDVDTLRRSLVMEMNLDVAVRFGTADCSATDAQQLGAAVDLMLRLVTLKNHGIVLGCTVIDDASTLRAVSTIAPELSANKLAKQPLSFQLSLIQALQHRHVAAAMAWAARHSADDRSNLEIDEQLTFLANTGNPPPAAAQQITNTATPASLSGMWVYCQHRQRSSGALPISIRNPPAPTFQASAASLIAAANTKAARIRNTDTEPTRILYPPEFKRHLQVSVNGVGITSNVADLIRAEAIASSRAHQLQAEPWLSAIHRHTTNLEALRTPNARNSIPHILRDPEGWQGKWLRLHPQHSTLKSAIEERVRQLPPLPPDADKPSAQHTCVLCLAKGKVRSAKGAHNRSLQCSDCPMRDAQVTLFKRTETLLAKLGTEDFFKEHATSINPGRQNLATLSHEGFPSIDGIKTEYPRMHAVGFLLFPPPAKNDLSKLDPKTQACLLGYRLVFPDALAITLRKDKLVRAKDSDVKEYVTDMVRLLHELHSTLIERCNHEAVALLAWFSSVQIASPQNPTTPSFADDSDDGVGGMRLIVRDKSLVECDVDGCSAAIEFLSDEYDDHGLPICAKCSTSLRHKQRTHSLAHFIRMAPSAMDDIRAEANTPVQLGGSHYLPMKYAYRDYTRAKHPYLASKMETRASAQTIAPTHEAALLLAANIPFSKQLAAEPLQQPTTVILYNPNNPANWCECRPGKLPNRDKTGGSLAVALFNTPGYTSETFCKFCFRLSLTIPTAPPTNEASARLPCILCAGECNMGVDLMCHGCHRWQHNPAPSIWTRQDGNGADIERVPALPPQLQRPLASCTRSTMTHLALSDKMGPNRHLCPGCATRIINGTAADHCATADPSFASNGSETYNPHRGNDNASQTETLVPTQATQDATMVPTPVGATPPSDPGGSAPPAQQTTLHAPHLPPLGVRTPSENDDDDTQQTATSSSENLAQNRLPPVHGPKQRYSNQRKQQQQQKQQLQQKKKQKQQKQQQHHHQLRQQPQPQQLQQQNRQQQQQRQNRQQQQQEQQEQQHEHQQERQREQQRDYDEPQTKKRQWSHISQLSQSSTSQPPGSTPSPATATFRATARSFVEPRTHSRSAL